MIFVQIAAYRDPEVLPTIQDCLGKAKFPNDIRFGICWQRDDSDLALEPFKGNRCFRIDEIPWHESGGLCWARSRIQKLYEGEEFTLQIDSHHRFAEDWDAKLLSFMELTGSPKPLLTSYAGAYDPRTNEKKGNQPHMMVGKKFSEHGTIPFHPHVIGEWQKLEAPVRARFVSGHFFFTLGRHCEEYHYDPNLYFAGDEISLSIRSFTLGFDLFHPHRAVIWHEYTRKGRVKHWDDHVESNRALVGQTWHERDTISKRRLRKLLREEENDEDLSGYDLGSARSHRDYELYAGIDFASRRLHQDAMDGVHPPCVYVDAEQWAQSFPSEHRLELRWNFSDLERCDDVRFVYFGVEDSFGAVIYRYDAPPESDEAQLRANTKKIQIFAKTVPAKLVVWPVSVSRGWLRKVVYPL